MTDRTLVDIRNKLEAAITDCYRGAHERGMTAAGVRDIACRLSDLVNDVDALASAQPAEAVDRAMPDGATFEDYRDQLACGGLTPIDQMAFDNMLHDRITHDAAQGAVALERWGKAPAGSHLLLQTMADGYWTPWHIAQDALNDCYKPTPDTPAAELLGLADHMTSVICDMEDPEGPSTYVCIEALKDHIAELRTLAGKIKESGT